MRLTHQQVEIIAGRIVQDLKAAGLAQIDDVGEVEGKVRQVIVEDLQVEDRLNEEVREIMRQHMERIRRADVEFHEMFKAIKAKLARERNIIL